MTPNRERETRKMITSLLETCSRKKGRNRVWSAVGELTEGFHCLSFPLISLLLFCAILHCGEKALRDSKAALTERPALSRAVPVTCHMRILWEVCRKDDGKDAFGVGSTVSLTMR